MLPSAAADVAAGYVLAAGAFSAQALWVAAGSVCVYAGGLALNDWADQAHDRATRPDRPIPSGAVPAVVALGLGWGLFGLGPLIALAAGRPASALLALAALGAGVYDLWGRGPLLGPTLLGFCRAANLGAGLVAGASARHAFPPPALVLAGAPLLYGAYVFVVSRLGRLEDEEDLLDGNRRPRAALAQAGLLIVLAGALGIPAQPAVGFAPPLALAAAGALGLVQLALSSATWTRGRVEAAMGQALRRLLVFTATLALCARGPHGLVIAAAILGGYPLSFWLRGLFPPS